MQSIFLIGYLHLLSLFFRTGLFSRDGAGAVVKSSKFIMINDMSSTSLRIGAITSEHRNFEPKIKIKIFKIGFYQEISRSLSLQNQ